MAASAMEAGGVSDGRDASELDPDGGGEREK